MSANAKTPFADGNPARALRFLLIGLLAACACLPASAQSDQGTVSGAEEPVSPEMSAEEEDIFGQEETVDQGSEGSSAVRDAFFTTEGVSLGGSFTGSAGLLGTWDDPWGGDFNLFKPDTAELSPATSIALGFSAKPEKNLSFYGEVRSAYPFVTTKTVTTVDDLGATVGTGTVVVPDIRIFKLYAKFDWQDKLFFSFGKQALKWGQGYFFTPANDILALDSVDFDDPDAEREGPLSLRINAPVPGTMATAYLFAIMNSASLHPSETGVAAKFEMAFPGIELSLAGYYQKDDAPHAIVSASYADNGWSFFGEGVAAFGSDKWFVVKDERTVDTPAIPPFVPAGEQAFDYRIVEKGGLDHVFLTGTLGALYSKSWEKKLDLTVAAQYLYDGEGQANMSLDDMIQAVIDRANPYYEYEDDPGIDLADPSAIATALSNFGSRLGRHYAGLSVSAGSILGSDVSASVFAMANLADLSGWVKPQVSWKIFDRMSVSGWANFGFGDGGDEFTNLGGIYKAVRGIDFDTSSVPPTFTYQEADLTPPMQLGITFSLGTGSF